jgi:hypothetical protein
MRSLTTAELSKLKIFTENSIEFSLIEPTITGLSKSILDATGPIREYLKKNGIHDYSLQLQGQENKVQIDANLIEADHVIKSVASLYRPQTKNGDPRIWFKSLLGYCKPNDILAIIVFKGAISAINISRLDIKSLVSGNVNNPLKELVIEISKLSNEIANELLVKLRKIAERGYIQSLISADTSVGRTLESLLNININSSRQPDYKGIELKSFRQKKRSNRKTLFAQVPDWLLGELKSSREILDAFGYKRGNEFKLYCTLSTKGYNSQGLQLFLDKELNNLIEISLKTGLTPLAVWPLSVLHNRLEHKHAETFWIGAETKQIDGKEYFKYTQAEHTKKPLITQFDLLIEQGIITMDHLIKRSGRDKVVEKGPLFKIKPSGLSLLFPPSIKYDLS